MKTHDDNCISGTREHQAVIAIAADRFDVPMAFIAMDAGCEIAFPWKTGLDLDSAPREIALCTRVIESDVPMVVGDLSATPEFHDHPVVTGPIKARFYAGTPIRDAAGATIGALSLIDVRPRDFSQKDLSILSRMAELVSTRIQISRRRLEHQQASLVDRVTGDAIVCSDGQGTITHWNPGAERLLGWTSDEMLGRSVSMLVSEDRRADQAERFRTISEASVAHGRFETRRENVVLHKDGTEIPVEISVGSSVEDGRIAVVSIVRDITERKRLEAQQAATHAMLDGVLENMPAAVFAKDRKTGIYLFANAAYERLTGFDRNELIGLSADDLFPADEVARLAEHNQLVEQSRHPVTMEHRATRKDGSSRIMKIRKMISTDQTGRSMILGFAEDVTEEREATARLAYLAHHDPLTGMLNRARFMNGLQTSIESGQKPAVICIDLDRFKIVNDLYGHAAGDEVLVEAANRLSEAAGAPVARLGGDEFAIHLPDGSTAAATARRIVDALARPFGIRDRGVGIGGSAGISHCDGSQDADQLMRNADLALYRAKRDGRNRYRFFEPAMDDAASERRRVEADLRQAIERGLIHVEYQPLADTQTGRIVSFEALARWDHPELGRISPALFIPIAEESGLMARLGRSILQQAASEAATWHPSIKVAVNLSPAQMEERTIVEDIASVLESTGLDPNRLEIEITEGMLIRDTARGIDVLTRLQALGVSVSMDDFGTGYSSLNYFRTFPFDKVKIDQSFIRDMHDNPQSLAIVQAVIGLGRGLSMPVVAEGVETQGQLEQLRDEGCAIVQGYHIGRPADISAYGATVSRGPRRDAA